MSTNHSTADRLNDHLDATVRGEATRSHDIDASVTVTVERFFAADDAPAPATGLADHVWEGLMNQLTAPVAHTPETWVVPGRKGWATLRFRVTRRPHHGPSAIAYLATAALLVLTLVGGFVASGGLLRLLGPDQRSVIPAIDSAPELARPSGAI